MKTSVIAPLGLSPPVITAFIKGIAEPINDVVVLTTDNEEVKKGYELVKIGLKIKYPRIRIHEIKLPFDDVYTTEQNLRFMAIAARTIKEEREVHRCDRIFLNIAGGRKNMCITLSLLGQLMGVDGVFHVVTKDVAIVNQMLESLREDIKRIYEAKDEEEKIKIYREKERYFNSLLFPAKSEYEIIRIPTLPYPADYLIKLVTAVHSSNLDSLLTEEKEVLYRHGILDKIGRRYIVSDYGRELTKIIVHPK
ncbi:CRISPR-associated protein Csx14 [Archaeoglobales archaeon]|nr:MAG: CRISPR-associated protein Csx14 [Archaeoglobales archaeon]